jgi:hypothetical protein
LDTENITKFLEKLSILDINNDIWMIVNNFKLLKWKDINLNMFIEENKIIFKLLIK